MCKPMPDNLIHQAAMKQLHGWKNTFEIWLSPAAHSL